MPGPGDFKNPFLNNHALAKFLLSRFFFFSWDVVDVECTSHPHPGYSKAETTFSPVEFYKQVRPHYLQYARGLDEKATLLDFAVGEYVLAVAVLPVSVPGHPACLLGYCEISFCSGYTRQQPRLA
jgi:hypothetical protein